MSQNIYSSELDPNLVSPGGTVKFCDNSNTHIKIGEKVEIGNTGNIKFLNEELNADGANLIFRGNMGYENGGDLVLYSGSASESGMEFQTHGYDPEYVKQQQREMLIQSFRILAKDYNWTREEIIEMLDQSLVEEIMES